MRYISTSLMITNSITYADGRQVKDILGGGVYSLQGIKLYTDDVLLVANVGADFEHYYGQWMNASGYSWDGIRIIGEKTSYDHLTYTEDGRWFNESIYGRDRGNTIFGEQRCRPEDIEPFITPDTKGMYTYFGMDSVVWNDWAQMKRRHNYQSVWEIGTWDSLPENREKTLAFLPDCDIFSINLPEALSLFSLKDEAQAVAFLKKLDTYTFFRVGEKGAYFTGKGEATFVPSLLYSGPEIDPTGCGNTSTCTAIYGLVEGYRPEMITALCNVSAYYNVQQLGPIPKIDETMRAQALEKAEALSKKAVKF